MGSKAKLDGRNKRYYSTVGKRIELLQPRAVMNFIKD
jgi:hypothetical protein